MATTSQNENLIIANNNLIETSIFPKDWMAVNLSEEIAKWKKSGKGIIQLKPVGSRKTATGSLFINRKNNVGDNNAIQLEAILGSTHQIGLVFNYMDKNDFSLFIVDQHSRSYRGYHIMIIEVRDGKFSTINKEFNTGRPLATSNFSILSDQLTLTFLFNSLEIFKWSGRKLEPDSKAGLYCQRNTDGVFSNLYLVDKASLDNPIDKPEKPIENPPIGEDPPPSGDGVEDPPPSGDGVEDPPPSGDGVEDPPPSGDGVEDPPPNGDGVEDTPPVSEDPPSTNEPPVYKPVQSQSNVTPVSTSNQLVYEALNDEKIEEKIIRNLSVRLPESTNPVHFSKITGLGHTLSRAISNLLSRDENGHVNNIEELRLIYTIGVQGSNPLEFNRPLGMSTDSVGNLYVADAGNKRIQKITPNGEHIRDYGGLEKLQNPEDIAIGKDQIFITDQIAKAIYIINSKGQLLGKITHDFKHPKGITIDEDDNIYLTDINTHKIYKFNNNGNLIWERGGYGKNNGQFSNPNGICYDSNSKSLFIADSVNKRVQKFSINGEYLLEVGGSDGFQSPYRVVKDNSGVIYVSDGPSNRHNGIIKIDDNGQIIGVHKVDGMTTVATSIALDSLGHLYVAFEYENKIIRLEPNGSIDEAWNQAFKDFVINRPKKICIDSNDNAFLLYYFGGDYRIIRIDSSLNISDSIALIQKGYPESIHADDEGNIYVLYKPYSKQSNDYAGVQKLDSDGNLLIDYASSFGFKYPVAMTPDSQGNLLVLDNALEQIILLSPDGSVQGNWSDNIATKSILKNGVDVFHDKQGNIYIPGYLYPPRVHKINVDNWSENTISGKNVFQQPIDITSDGKGAIYVADWKGRDGITVHKMNEHGKILDQLTINDVASTVFYLNIDLANNIYICDSFKGNVIKIDTSGKRITDWESTFNSNAQTDSTGGIAFDRYNNIYLVDSGKGLLRKFDYQGVLLETLTGSSPFESPRSLTIDENDNLYVIDNAKNAIIKLSQTGNVIWSIKGGETFINPIDITYDNDQYLYLLDVISKVSNVTEIDYKLIRINKTTQSITALESAVENKSIMKQPLSVVADQKGNLYVCDTFSGLFKLNKDGTLISRLTGNNENDKFFNNPSNVRIDKDGFIYLMSTTHDRITIFDNDGNYYTHWGNLDKESEHLQFPVGMAIGSDDSIYVVELNKNTIKKYSPWRSKPELNHKGFGDDKVATKFIDLRSESWLHTWKKLNTDLDFATNRRNHAEDKYNDVKTPIEGEELSLSEIDNIEGRYRIAIEKELQAKLLKDKFLSFLKSQDILENNVEEGADAVTQKLKEHLMQNTNELNTLKSELEDSVLENDIREYKFMEGEYVDQYGISLQDHVLKLSTDSDLSKDNVMIIPISDSGDEKPEQMAIIRNPQLSGKQIHPLSILFEENYIMDVTWSGIGLGEFSHSVNLFPGEEREMKIVSAKKRSWETVMKTSQLSKSGSSSEAAVASKRNDSFEDNLQNSLDNSNEFKTSDSSTSTSSTDFKTGAKAGGSWGPFSASVDANYAKKNSGTSKKDSSSKLSSIAKTARNTASKSSSEVSQNNKVSFSSSTELSQNLESKIAGEDSETETTTISISNINEGKTINYNFFQVTNIYATTIRIDDLKVHINTGIEIIPGTGITIKKTYDAENIRNMLHDFSIYSSEDRKRLLMAIVAQLITRYFFITGDVIDDDPQILRTKNVEPEQLIELREKCFDLLANLDEEDKDFDELFDEEFSAALDQFIKSKFYIQPFEIGEKDFYVVNSGKYYVDAQVGLKPATEAYLERRREIETERQKALVEELKQRTEKGVFFQELPEGMSSLSLNDHFDHIKQP